jgi:uncharacterized protein YecE (DUF72 family)
VKLLTANFYSGISGLVLPVPNKEHYPPEFKEKSRLCYYSSLFDSIEVNSSFYRIPQAKTIAKWANDVPADFKFTFKLWRGITHEKGLTFKPEDVHRFIRAVDTAGTHKGCVLIQLPPSAKAPLMPQLKDLMSVIHDADHKWQLALELRHSSWYNDMLLDFAESQKIAIVLQDIPTSVTPLNFATGNVVYLRFHGPGGKYRGTYSEDVLQEYSCYIREWQAENKTVYAYFNNTMGDAVKNRMTLNAFVRQIKL